MWINTGLQLPPEGEFNNRSCYVLIQHDGKIGYGFYCFDVKEWVCYIPGYCEQNIKNIEYWRFFPDLKGNVYHGIFHTSIASIGKIYYCDDDCKQSGCPGHNMMIETNSVSGSAQLFIDGVLKMDLQCNSANALYTLLDDLIKKR